MRVLLLVNATASSVTARKRVMIRKMLSADHEVELAETTRRGHATRLAHAAANDGFDVVAVLAGDGTLNEAADGLLHSATALAPLPGGSTNVYARTLGYPNDAVAAAQLLLGLLVTGSTKRIGVGLSNRRPFLFNTGIGFDAAVIRRVERYGELKRYVSHPLHVAAAVEAFFRKEGTNVRLTVELDSGETIEGSRFIIVSKTDPYTYLGRIPLRVAPTTTIETPLAVTAFRSLDALTLVGGAASAMRKGEFLAHRKGVDHRADVRRVIIRAPEPFAFQVDGDDALITACLVDGARSKTAIECREADALDAVRVVREALSKNGWSKWAHAMPAGDLERSGQQLELIRRTGPKPLRSPELDVLVATLGQFWPTR